MKVCFKKEEKFMLILVVNAGSSSLKYQVRDTSAPEAEQMITSGLIENIGTDVPDHEVALHMMAEKLEAFCTAVSCRLSVTAWCRVPRSLPTPCCSTSR